MRVVRVYFVLDVEQSIPVAIFAKGLEEENCLPTEYSGYASVAGADIAGADAVWTWTWSEQ